ncbi:MAG: glycosyltransferase family 4 protein [Spirochaetales bacterium]|nr:glycosyltransferase family 4 protein [Spirochaetales bacterium]
MTESLEKKRVAYVGSSHHVKKTKSTVFLLNLLQENYDLDLIITDDWVDGRLPADVHLDDRYHAVIFFQSVPQGVWEIPIQKNFVFAPMYDQSGADPVENWIVFKDFKILSFSKTLGKKLKAWGLRTFSTLYYPEPKPMPSEPDPGSLFFWQRRPEVAWPLIRQLLPAKYLKKVHLHFALDRGEPVYPTEEEQKNLSFTLSTWFDTNEQIQKLIQKHELYVAPRLSEGIGFSFLEAMARGAVVIAVDSPTMNEYIQHEQTGYLFNPRRPVILDVSKIAEIRRRLPAAMERGFREWQQSRTALIQFIDEPIRPLGWAWPLTFCLAKCRLFLRALKRKVRSLF